MAYANGIREYCDTCGRFTDHRTRDGETRCSVCDGHASERRVVTMLREPDSGMGAALAALPPSSTGRARNE